VKNGRLCIEASGGKPFDDVRAMLLERLKVVEEVY